jgi:hypothetical protein
MCPWAIFIIVLVIECPTHLFNGFLYADTCTYTLKNNNGIIMNRSDDQLVKKKKKKGAEDNNGVVVT